MRREREQKSFSLPPPHLCGLTPHNWLVCLSEPYAQRRCSESCHLAISASITSLSKHSRVLTRERGVRASEQRDETLDPFNLERPDPSREKATPDQPPSRRDFKASPTAWPKGEEGSRSRARRNAALASSPPRPVIDHPELVVRRTQLGLELNGGEEGLLGLGRLSELGVGSDCSRRPPAWHRSAGTAPSGRPRSPARSAPARHRQPEVVLGLRIAGLELEHLHEFRLCFRWLAKVEEEDPEGVPIAGILGVELGRPPGARLGPATPACRSGFSDPAGTAPGRGRGNAEHQCHDAGGAAPLGHAEACRGTRSLHEHPRGRRHAQIHAGAPSRGLA